MPPPTLPDPSVVLWRTLRNDYLRPFVRRHANDYGWGWDRGFLFPDNIKDSLLFRSFAMNAKARLDQHNIIANDVWLKELVEGLRRYLKMLRHKVQLRQLKSAAKQLQQLRSAEKRRVEEQDSSSNPVSTSETQCTSKPVDPSNILVRFSVGEKNVDARSVLLSKLVEDTTKCSIDLVTRLSAAKLMQVIRQKYPDLSKKDYDMYDRTFKDENTDTIVDNDDLQAAVNAAMQRADGEIHFVVVLKEDTGRSWVTRKTFISPEI